jgi:uncharacterized protein DUF4262
VNGQLTDEARDRGIALDDVNARNLEAIDRDGWAVVMVAPRPGESFPAFAYTVGLSRRVGSELIMVGLDPYVAGRILNSIATDAVEAGDLQEGPLPNVLEGDRVLDLRQMDPSRYNEYLGRLLWFHDKFERGPLRVMQVVWPDKQGIFPDEDDLTPEERKLQPQPLLDRP